MEPFVNLLQRIRVLASNGDRTGVNVDDFLCLSFKSNDNTCQKQSKLMMVN